MKLAPPSPTTKNFRLLLASTRWAVHTFFVSLRGYGLPTILVEPIPSDPDLLDARDKDLELASVVAVDMAAQAQSGLDLCRALIDRRPALPVLALVCCPHAANPWELQTLLGAGVSILDLQATPEEAARALESVARGASVLNLHLHRGHRELLRDVLSGREPTRITKTQLLQLVAAGLPDHEIGRRLHLSPHTVKHHIETLRREVRARNRTELAAWAGRHGFYSPDADGGDGAVAIQIAQPRRR
jgi:DNA-binding NarL/FixJ family response regulator